jgi:hypothetical protein
MNNSKNLASKKLVYGIYVINFKSCNLVYICESKEMKY